MTGLTKALRHRLPDSAASSIFMLSAAIVFTFSNVLIKLLGPHYSAWHIAFFRFAGGLIFLLTLFGRHNNPYSGNNRHLLIFRGFQGAVTFTCFITAIRLLPVSTALLIIYSFPAFAAIFSYLLYSEHTGISQIACIGVAIVGIGILFDFKTGSNFSGYIVAVATSALSGLTVTLTHELRKSNGPVIIYLYVCTFGALATLPMFIIHPVFPHSALEWTMIMAIILSSGIAQLLMNQGFYFCQGWEGGVLMSSEAIFTVAAGILILGDPVTWRFIIGGLIIFASSVVLNRIKAAATDIG